MSRFITLKLISYGRLMRTLTKNTTMCTPHWGNHRILTLKTPTSYQVNLICRPQGKSEVVTTTMGKRSLWFLKKTCLPREAGLIPELRRSSERGYDNPLQYSCLENPTGKGVWQAIVHWVAKSWTWLKQLRAQACNKWPSVKGRFLHS